MACELLTCEVVTNACSIANSVHTCIFERTLRFLRDLYIRLARPSTVLRCYCFVYLHTILYRVRWIKLRDIVSRVWAYCMFYHHVGMNGENNKTHVLDTAVCYTTTNKCTCCEKRLIQYVYIYTPDDNFFFKFY